MSSDNTILWFCLSCCLGSGHGTVGKLATVIGLFISPVSAATA